MADLSTDSAIQDLLKLPIEDACYMIASSWWSQWTAFVSTGEKRGSEPGIIYNLDLVYSFHEHHSP